MPKEERLRRERKESQTVSKVCFHRALPDEDFPDVREVGEEKGRGPEWGRDKKKKRRKIFFSSLYLSFCEFPGW